METQSNTQKTSETDVRGAPCHGDLATRLTEELGEELGGIFRHASGNLADVCAGGSRIGSIRPLHNKIAASDVQIVFQIPRASIRAD